MNLFFDECPCGAINTEVWRYWLEGDRDYLCGSCEMVREIKVC